MPNQVSQYVKSATPSPGGAMEVWGLVRELALAAEGLEQRQAEDCGLRRPLFRLLDLAAGSGDEGLVVSNAAELLGLRPQALNRPAGELETEGLLWREVDQADARARRLRITPAGQARLVPARALETELLKRISQAIPQASVAKLVLQRLVGVLEPAQSRPALVEKARA